MIRACIVSFIMQISIECFRCKENFIKKGKRVKFCTDECRLLSRNELYRANTIRLCNYKPCSRQFKGETRTQRYCKLGCREKQRKLRYIENRKDIILSDVACIECTEMFMPCRWDNIICSDNCRHIRTKRFQNISAKKVYHEKKLQRTCSGCGLLGMVMACEVDRVCVECVE